MGFIHITGACCRWVLVVSMIILSYTSGSCSGSQTDYRQKGFDKAEKHIRQYYLGSLFNFPSWQFLQINMQYLYWYYAWQGMSINDFKGTREQRSQALVHLVTSTSFFTPKYLVINAVSGSFNRYPNSPDTLQELAKQLAYIVLEVCETSMKGWALGILRTEADKRHPSNIHGYSKRPYAFYRQYIDEFLLGRGTPWFNHPQSKKYDKDLAFYFIHPLYAGLESTVTAAAATIISGGVIFLIYHALVTDVRSKKTSPSDNAIQSNTGDDDFYPYPYPDSDGCSCSSACDSSS